VRPRQQASKAACAGHATREQRSLFRWDTAQCDDRAAEIPQHDSSALSSLRQTSPSVEIQHRSRGFLESKQLAKARHDESVQASPRIAGRVDCDDCGTSSLSNATGFDLLLLGLLHA
jgi:hypothetical protein